MLRLVVKRDKPIGASNWLTVVSPSEPDGTELLLEPAGHPTARVYQQALYADDIPLTALMVDDPEKEYARLKALGVDFKVEPEPKGAANVAVLDDTCGNYIMHFQPETRPVRAGRPGCDPKQAPTVSRRAA